MKYMQKPIFVEAIQFTRENIDEIEKWCKDIYDIKIERKINGLMTAMLSVIDGECVIHEYDYIIKNEDGFFICEPNIFYITYNKINKD